MNTNDMLNTSIDLSTNRTIDVLSTLNESIKIDIEKIERHSYRLFQIKRYQMTPSQYNEIEDFGHRFFKNNTGTKVFANQTLIPNKLKFSSTPRSAVITKHQFTKPTNVKLINIISNFPKEIIIHVSHGKITLRSYKNRRLNHFMIPNYSYTIDPSVLNDSIYLRFTTGMTTLFLEIFKSFESLLFINDFHSNASHSYAFIDCEMACLPNNKQCLTSICILDEDESVIVNTLVSPVNTVKNYVTRITGLNERKLAGCLDETAAVYIAHQVSQKCVLVGADLRNDLKVLRLDNKSHVRIIDLATSPFIKSKMNSNDQFIGLKKMTKFFLNDSIQDSHHTAYEDTLAVCRIFNIFKIDLIRESYNDNE